MPQNISDTAYIQADPNCIGKHFIEARGKLFEYIGKIAEEMGKIATSVTKEREKSTRKLNAGEWYQNVVSILGERGSGKTILLLSACACLGKTNDSSLPSGHNEEDWEKYEKICQKVINDILLPVIQPEYFGAEDTLITWVLTYLKDYVEDKNNKDRFKTKKIQQYDDDDGVTPSEFIEEMRLSEALFSRKFSSNLAEQDVTAQDFQHETIKVIDSQFNFMRNWRKLVNKLMVKDEKNRTESTSTKRNEHPFLIIPIDDADLNPASLPIILQQIQFLQHPNVLFLFSVHKKSLHSMMYLSQLELNTNRVDSRPVVNFENLIKHGLRDVEDVRVDAWNKIEKFLPRKYRVEVQPLPPEQRLNFKPLVKREKNGKDEQTDQDGITRTFLQLLEQITLDVFGNKRLKNITQFFDLAQSFKRCPLIAGKECKNCLLPHSASCSYKNNIPLLAAPQHDSNAIPFCMVCELSQSQGNELHCRNPMVKARHTEYEERIKTQNQDTIERLFNDPGNVSSPIPSIYVDALPKYPRAMEQVYQILQSWVKEIKSVKKINNYDELKGKVAQKIATDEERILETKTKKELQLKISQAVKELLTTCLEYIPLLPRAFYHRIKFIDNPNPASNHPIQITFETDSLTNIIKASGEGTEINASTDAKSSRILSIHPITNYLMYVPGKKRDVKTGLSEEVNPIPNEWDIYYIDDDHKKKKEENEDITYYRVPNEYFAVYNLAYDLTTSNRVFGRTINHNNQYQMRDGKPVSIFSVRTGTSPQFTDCYCAMPRWYRIADYNLFALAWNDLVGHVDDIMHALSLENIIPNNHVLSDWVVLSLLRIHICLEMNYTPFLVTNEEKKKVLARIIQEPFKEWESSEEPIASMRHFVKQGLYSVMEHIKLESRRHALPKHHQAFKTWIEYGLPMLSNGDYVSEDLGKWITYQWIMLLITEDDNKSGGNRCPDCFVKCNDTIVTVLRNKYGINIGGNADQSKLHTPLSDCENCAFSRLYLIAAILESDFDDISLIRSNHFAKYFLPEYLLKQGQNRHRIEAKSLRMMLGIFLSLWGTNSFTTGFTKDSERLWEKYQELQKVYVKTNADLLEAKTQLKKLEKTYRPKNVKWDKNSTTDDDYNKEIIDSYNKAKEYVAAANERNILSQVNIEQAKNNYDSYHGKLIIIGNINDIIIDEKKTRLENAKQIWQKSVGIQSGEECIKQVEALVAPMANNPSI